jgi:hypothetical protein
MEKKWIKEIDIIQFSIILIVFPYLHYFINLQNLKPISNILSNYLTLIGVILFFFISKLGLYYNYHLITTFKELIYFYQKNIKFI